MNVLASIFWLVVILLTLVGVYTVVVAGSIALGLARWVRGL